MGRQKILLRREVGEVLAEATIRRTDCRPHRL
jgi:hypothetical protein